MARVSDLWRFSPAAANPFTWRRECALRGTNVLKASTQKSIVNESWKGPDRD